MDRWAEKEYLEGLWNDSGTQLKLFYSEYNYFKRQYDKEIDKILYGATSSVGPKRTWDQRELKEMTLQEWIAHDLVSGMKLKDEVFKAAEFDGKYKCVICGLTSPNRKDFQIDHIKPMSKGGLTEKDNLQLLCRKCNWIKSDHEDDMPFGSREVSGEVLPSVRREGDDLYFRLGDDTVHCTITPERKKRGYLTFTFKNEGSYKYKIRSEKIERI